MTQPLPGQVYERDGLRREVVDVQMQVCGVCIVWIASNGGQPCSCWPRTWNEWASKATLVETKHET